jgi:hypothetical protein
MLLVYFMQINSSRYFTYVTLGGAVLLAYLATREKSRDVRLGVVCLVALAMFLWDFSPWSLGAGLITEQDGQNLVATLNVQEEKQSWREGDLVLYRSGFLESDFLPNGIPEATQAHVERAAAAPITTLYASKSPRPYVLLSLSQRRNDDVRTKLGKHKERPQGYDPAVYYTDELAEKIGRHSRYWLLTNEWNRRGYIASLIPWMANSLHWDLLIARKRKEPERYFLVASGSQPNDYVAGLNDSRTDDFTQVVLVRKAVPSGGFSLGAVGASLTPNSHLTVPVWLVTQCPTPRLTQEPTVDGSTANAEGVTAGGGGK